MLICRKIQYRKVVQCLALLAETVLLLASCDAGGDVVAVGESPGSMTVALHLSTGDTGITRAPELSNDDNTVAENRIDIEGDDYRILIFRHTTADDGSKNMVFYERFMPLLVERTDNTKERQYMLQGVVSVTPELKSGQLAQETFSIMVLANWQSFGADYDDISLEAGKTTVADVVELARQEPFIMPTATWRPYEDGNKGIPMCGVKEFVLTDADIKQGATLNIVDPIMMLRAVAKIEIIDNLYEGNRDVGCGVRGAWVSRYNKTGTLICDMAENPDWHVETTQVIKPTLPAAPPEQGGDLEMSHTGNGDEGHPIYEVYVPEFDMNGLIPGDVRRPAIKLQIKKPGKETDLLGYIVDIADYATGTPGVTDDYRYLLRNHIYRFELVGSPENPERQLTINYTVCPWDVRTAGDIRFE